MIREEILWIALPESVPIELGAKLAGQAQPRRTTAQLDLIHLPRAALQWTPLPVGPKGGISLQPLPLPWGGLYRHLLAMATPHQLGHHKSLGLGRWTPTQRSQPHLPLTAGTPRLPAPIQGTIGLAAPLAMAAHNMLNSRQRQLIQS
jgi:hypothetical protein